MNYFCDACDRTIKIKSRSRHGKSLTHNEFEKRLRKEHTIQNLDLFDVDEIFIKYITNQTKKLILILQLKNKIKFPRFIFKNDLISTVFIKS